MRRGWYLFIIMLFLPTIVCSQFMSVYDLHPVVVSNGLGGTGVSYTTENNFLYNPGNLGLLAFERKIYLTGYIQKANLSTQDLSNFSISIPFSLSPYSKIALAYNMYKTEPGEYVDNSLWVETEYYGNKFQTFTAALGVKSGVDFGMGVSINYIEEDNERLPEYAVTADFGARVGHEFVIPSNNPNYHFSIYPSFGGSISNYSIETEKNYIITIPSVFVGYYSYDYRYLVEKTRAGFSTRIALEGKDNFEYVTLLTAYEYEKLGIYRTSFYNYGAEIVLFETAGIRLGKNRDHFSGSGFTIKSNGLEYFSKNMSPLNSVLSKLHFSFNYSRRSLDGTGPTERGYQVDYYELTVGVDI